MRLDGLVVKPSRNMKVAQIFLSLELATSNIGYLSFFIIYFICAKFQQDYTLHKSPPMMFFDFVIYQKFKGGMSLSIIDVVQFCWNFAQLKENMK